MSVFSFQAVDSSTRDVRGTVAADSAREAREKLRAQGLHIEAITPQEMKTSRGWRILDRPGRNAARVAMSIRELATLLGAGIGLVDALDTLAAQYRGRFQASLLDLRERVAAGSSLSEAMRAQPGIYDDLTVQMVTVGENAGTLDAVLDQLADFRDRYLMFKDQITTALLYPAIVVTLAMGVSIFLMTVVLPMLLENLIASGRPLPWPTRVLKTISELATTHGWWLAIVLVPIGIGTFALFRTTWGRRVWDRAVFALPVLGLLARKQEIARAAIVISTLMKSGIVFVEAVQTAARATKNILLREALDAIRQRVLSGGDIGDAVATSAVFPPLVVQIFTVGQQTGNLEPMLDRLADGYEKQVGSAMTRLAAALEPILIVFLAIVVGFILFATILPILEAGNVL